MESRDNKRRFLFEQMDTRGEIVHLSEVLKDIGAIHDYPSGVASLLGEFVAASVLLAGTLKFEGSLTVQARSERQIPLIMAECSSDLRVRAIARGAQEALATRFEALVGGGQLALTITPDKGKRYQGIVPLDDHSLAASIDSYFSQSEQLQSRLFLFSDGTQAAGLMLQQLPVQVEKDPRRREENWQRLALLAETISAAELLELADEKLLMRLFHEETVRLFDPETVTFECSCSRDRTLSALLSIGEAEIRDILAEQGAVTMDCEFCNQRYVFADDELSSMLADGEGHQVH